MAAQAEAPWQPSWWDEAVDWTVGSAGSLVDGGVDLLSDVPMLGTAAATMAPVTKFAWETLGGFAKGAGDLVGGLGHMVAHPLDTLGGLATMAEHIPGSPLKPLHKLYDVATTDQTLKETFWRNPLDVAKEDLSADWEFWKGVGGAILDPYERSVEQGKYGEALGRGIFDIGGLFLGASEVRALGKGAEAASAINKVDDSVKVAGKVNELGAVTDDLVRAGGKADDVTKVASYVDEVTDLSKVKDLSGVFDETEDAAQSTSVGREGAEVADRAESVLDEVDELPPAAAELGPRRRATPEDYGRIETKAEVPEHYSSDPRFDDLSADPDHAGKVTDKSVKEAMTGLEAERQGLVKAPIERGPRGIEFYDANGTPYDVKTPPSPATGAPFKFKPTASGSSILKQVRKLQPNKRTGQDEFVQVLLDTSYMTSEDLSALRTWLQKNAAPEELERIIELSVEL